MRIAILGATGTTGRLVARKLAEAGLSTVLAGRSERRLRALCETLAAPASTTRLALPDPDGVAHLASGVDVLVNCVAPYGRHGLSVAASTVEGGAHLVDMAGEQGYVHALRELHEAAEVAGVAVVPAVGVEGGLGDVAAALLAPEGARVRAFEAVSWTRWVVPSRGSLRSALHLTGRETWMRVGGRLVPAAPGSRLRRLDLEGRRRTCVFLPVPEIITVPWHLDCADAAGWVALPVGLGAFARGASGLVCAVVRSAPAGLVRGVDGALGTWRFLGASGAFRIQIRLLLEPPGGAREVLLTGSDVYDLTAEMVCLVARWLADRKGGAGGVLAPSRALPLDRWWQALRRWGVVAEE